MEEERIPEIVKESTVWDVYNNEARKVDNELVKDWTASLNFLLIFAAIFAAVLTAFIIESKKMLEPDQTEILVDIAIQYFNSIGNQSRNNLARPAFEPTSAAISINCLLFSSLGASLVAALAGVVALQWVADYDAAITRGGSSPEDRAKRRQFRFAGVVGWKMSEIIASLPLLLYSSVILFWAGAIQWMWSLHHIVGYVVACGTAIAVLFYACTTLLGAIYVSSPFRTPLSRGLYWLPRWLLRSVGRLLMWLLIDVLFRWFSSPLRRMRSQIRSLISTGARISGTMTGSEDSTTQTPIREIIKPLTTTSRQREERAAELDPAFRMEALAWLAEQLPISAESHHRLLLLLIGVLSLPPNMSLSSRFLEVPWLAIIEVLSKHFMRHILNPNSSETDYQGAEILLNCIERPFMRSRVIPGATYWQGPKAIRYWKQCCLEANRVMDSGSTEHAPMAFLLARDVPIPSLGSKGELEANCKLIRWRNSLGLEARITDIWPEIFGDIGRYSPEFFKSCLFHFRTWTNILYRVSTASDYATMFDNIARQALDRDLTIEEAFALAQAFAACVTAQGPWWFSEAVNEKALIPQPLSYTFAVAFAPQRTLEAHQAITLLVVRAAEPLLKMMPTQWVRWIVVMLWIGSPKEHGYLEGLKMRKNTEDEGETRHLWNKVERTMTGLPFQSPHIEEVSTILWRLDDEAVVALSVDAFKYPERLTHLELLFQCASRCHDHHAGSQHFLVHLYQGARSDYRRSSYVGLYIAPVSLANVEWSTERFNPILAMLALSATQDLTSLHFGEAVNLECAARILEIFKEVKRRATAFLCLITDIVTARHRGFRPIDLAIILESVKQAMALLDEETATFFLRRIAWGLQALRREMWFYKSANPGDRKRVAAEVRKIYNLLQTKSATRLISSTTQLKLLVCARSAAVAQPAMGWLGIHEPI